ncbi:hypothetical protein, partial [Nonomuraea glycinis]|uniref:hypothetical protein n=1 Tax=Nonomuraea glycinis TaxID=2047744 RepID=UPI0033AAD2AF
MSRKRTREIRKLMASTGMKYTEACRENDRRQQNAPAKRRRRRSLTIEEIINAISPGIEASLRPQARIAKLVQDL